MKLKIDIINMAYAHMMISGVTVAASSEDNAIALDVMEDMAAELNSRNICTEYNIQDEPDLNDVANVPRKFLNAFKTNLAVRLIAAFGRPVPPTLMQQANQSMANMSSRTAQVRQVQYPHRQPRGSANSLRFNRWRRYYTNPDQAPISCATNAMKINEVNDYVEHFDSYLNDGEDVDTFTIEADSGLSVESSSNSFTDVEYRVKAVSVNDIGTSWQLVRVTITTTDGRVEVREVSFDITA